MSEHLNGAGHSSPEQIENANGRVVPAEQDGDGSPERAATKRSVREWLETEVLRDRLAGLRDTAARERDERAAARDREAASSDHDALALDGRDRILDRHTLRVEELRSRSAAVRARAAEDRVRAARDRQVAARDREHAARDREHAARDREQAARDRERAASDLKQAGVDELTGARRRGTGLEEMRREIERARRTNGGLVAAFIDVDDLKSVNDKHGHRAGDELLRDVAVGLASRMRAYDLVVRVGGDEFLCVLPDVTPGEARRRLDALVSDLHDGPALRSVSFGLSELRDADSLEELIDRADRDLLDGRRQRRSRSSRLGVKGRRASR